jgi:hypothetical protein
MGNFAITVHGVGCHHNQRPDDVEHMADRFVADLKNAGHNVMRAIVHTGGEIDLIGGRSNLLPVANVAPTVLVGREKSGGQIGYEGYCAATGWKSLVSGADLPQWADLKPEIRAAWESAALAWRDVQPELVAG